MTDEERGNWVDEEIPAIKACLERHGFEVCLLYALSNIRADLNRRLNPHKEDDHND